MLQHNQSLQDYQTNNGEMAYGNIMPPPFGATNNYAPNKVRANAYGSPPVRIFDYLWSK